MGDVVPIEQRPGFMGTVTALHPNQIRKGNRPEGKPRGVKGGQRGTPEDRRRRRQYLVETYRADRDLKHRILHVQFGNEETVREIPGVEEVPLGDGEPACRCYRCGRLMTVDTLTVDRIVPGCVKTAKYPKGGTYVRQNIRPACSDCNSETGGALASRKKK